VYLFIRKLNYNNDSDVLLHCWEVPILRHLSESARSNLKGNFCIEFTGSGWCWSETDSVNISAAPSVVVYGTGSLEGCKLPVIVPHTPYPTLLLM